MTLRGKIATVIALLVIGIGGVGGLTFVYSTYRHTIASIDAALNTCVREVKAQSGDDVGAALFVVRNQEVPVSVTFNSLDGAFTTLRDAGAPAIRTLSDAVLRSALAQPISVPGVPDYRLRTLALQDNEFLMFSASLTAAQTERSKGLELLVVLLVLATIAAVGLVRFVVKADIDALADLTFAATKIASGGGDTFPAGTGGGAEVVRLRSALHAMAETINGALADAGRANRQLREFLADASHELRTPLTVVTGYLDLLQHDRLEPEVRHRALDRSLRELERMDELVESLLVLARLGELDTALRARVDVGVMLQTEVEKLQDLQPGRHIVSTVAVDAVVMGDERALGSCLGNAFANIRRHTTSDAAVHVEARVHAGQVELQIDDAGPGFPEYLLVASASGLPRFSTALSKDTGGFGLGLHLMHRVAESHGGTMVLGNNPDGGARVTLVLPQAP